MIEQALALALKTLSEQHPGDTFVYSHRDGHIMLTQNGTHYLTCYYPANLPAQLEARYGDQATKMLAAFIVDSRMEN